MQLLILHVNRKVLLALVTKTAHLILMVQEREWKMVISLMMSLFDAKKKTKLLEWTVYDPFKL